MIGELDCVISVGIESGVAADFAGKLSVGRHHGTTQGRGLEVPEPKGLQLGGDHMGGRTGDQPNHVSDRNPATKLES